MGESYPVVVHHHQGNDACQHRPHGRERRYRTRWRQLARSSAITFPATTFNDVDATDTLTYSAKKADDSALPTWLAFDTSTRIFSGTPTAAETFSVKVTASDGTASATDEFDITVSAAATTEVPANWSLKPTGLTTGNQFRLMFLSSTKRNGTPGGISTYNTFIQALAAAGHTHIQSYSTGFRVVGCTNSVDARDNTSTTGTGVAIYWLNGNKVADDYADFYDGDWDDEVNNKNESGSNGLDTSDIANYPITGCDHDGTKKTGTNLGSSTSIAVGKPNSSSGSDGPLNGQGSAARDTVRPMYGLSGLFQVAPSTDATLSALTVSPIDITGFASDRTSYEVGVFSTVFQSTITPTTNDSAATVGYSTTDADGTTDGHQVSLSAGRNAVTVTVTAEDTITTQTYTLSINRGVTADFGWKASDDFDGLITAENEFPQGHLVGRDHHVGCRPR